MEFILSKQKLHVDDYIYVIKKRISKKLVIMSLIGNAIYAAVLSGGILPVKLTHFFILAILLYDVIIFFAFFLLLPIGLYRAQRLVNHHYDKYGEVVYTFYENGVERYILKNGKRDEVNYDKVRVTETKNYFYLNFPLLINKQEANELNLRNFFVEKGLLNNIVNFT